MMDEADKSYGPKDRKGTPLQVGDVVRFFSYTDITNEEKIDHIGKIISLVDHWCINVWDMRVLVDKFQRRYEIPVKLEEATKMDDKEAMLWKLEN